MKEYKILHYNNSAGTVNLKILYQYGNNTYVIVDEIDVITVFKPYKKNYNNLTEITNAALNDTVFNYTFNYVTRQPILKDTNIMFAV